MSNARRTGHRAIGLLATLAVVLTTAVVTHQSAVAAPAAKVPTKHHGSALGEKQDYDARQGSSATSKGAISRRAAKASSRTATQQLRSSLGDQAIVEMDGTTGTVRVVARLNGFLTAANSKPAPTIVMSYLATHLAALGLTRNDLATFDLRRDYVDIIGTHHLSWTQSVDGDPVFGNGLQANVNKHGRILSLGGSPISGLFTPKRGTQRVATKNAAIAHARADVSEPIKAGPRDTAKRVVFVGPGGPRAAWQVVTMSSQRPTVSVVDAQTGAVVYRRNLRDDARADDDTSTRTAAATTGSSGLAFRYFPKHVPGGTPVRVNFTDAGLARPATRSDSSGNNSHTYSDVNDDNQPDGREEVAPVGRHRWDYRLKPFHLAERRPSATTRARARGTRTSRSPGGPTARRTRRRSSSSSTTGTTTCCRRRSASPRRPATSSCVNRTGKAGKGGDAGRHPDRRRREHRPTACPTATTSTTPTWTRRRTASAPTDADVPAAPARHVVPGRRPVLADQRR